MASTASRVVLADPAALPPTGHSAPTLLVERAGDSDLALSALDLGPDATYVLEPAECDRLFLAHDGAAQAIIDGVPVELPVGGALFVRAGKEARLTASRNGARLVVGEAFAECDRHAPLGQTMMHAHVEADDVERATGSRMFQILFGPENGSTRATFFVGYVPPGRAPWHFHQYDEIVWIWNGAGRFHLQGEVNELASGSAFRIHPREVHIVENLGDEHLILVGLFTPAGSPAAAYLAYPEDEEKYR